MKILVVDNGSQWTHRIYRVLRDLDCDSKLILNTTALKELSDVDGLVLSGGAMRVGKGEESSVGGSNELYLRELSVPILGVCAGMQIIGKHFGSRVAPSKTPEFGPIELVVDEEDELFGGVPKKSVAWASHNDEVAVLPKDFVRLAHSKDVAIHAFRHSKKPVFGTLFHPEVEHTQYGEEIYSNFISVCRK